MKSKHKHLENRTRKQTQWRDRALTAPAWLAVLIVLAAGAPMAQAQTTASGTWNVDAGGNWSATANWTTTPSGNYPYGAGQTASLTLDIDANLTVTVDVNSLTLGILTIGDANITHSYTLAGSGSPTLTFDNSGLNAQLNQVATSKGDTLANTLSIALNSSLDIANASANALTINAPITTSIAGVKTISNLGTGTGAVTLGGNITDGGGSIAIVQSSSTSALILSGAANTFAGSVTVNSGTLSVNSAGAFNNIPRTVTVNSVGVVNSTVANGLSSASVTVNSGGLLQAANSSGNLVGFANAFAGSSITLNGGTLKINANPLGNTTSATTTVVGGNILVNADSIVNAFDSRSGTSSGRYVNEIQFGSLAFAAADLGTYPNGYKLRTTDNGRPNYRTSRTYTRFTNSTIANNGTLGVYGVTGGESFNILSTLDNTAIRAGKTLLILNEQRGSAKLINTLGVALLGGAELLNANAFTMIDASSMAANLTDNSTFDTTGGLWSRSGTTTITATLAASPLGSIAYGQTASFTSASSGFVNLTGLTVGNTYPLTLTLANPAKQATVVAQLAKNPTFSNVSAYGASQVTMQFTAQAATTYFVWDNVHSSPADWYLGDNLITVYMGPSMNASASLSAFVTKTGTPSAAQNVAVAGVNLTANITCVAPSGFELSTDGSTYAGTVSFTPGGANGSVSGTLRVRIAAATAPGAYGGNVTLSSDNATSINIPVSGAVYPVSGSATITQFGTLNEFIGSLGIPSPAQTIFVCGGDLTTGITCTPPSGYEVSTDGATYGGTATVTQSGGLASGTLYIRLASSATVGSHNGNVVLSSAGATPVNVGVIGTVYGTPTITTLGTLTPFSTIYGTASAAQSGSVGGSSLTVNLTCTAPAGFELSADGSTYAGSVSFTPSHGSVSGTLYVRIAATTWLGSYSGNVVLTSGSATPVNLSVSGTVVAAEGDGIWTLDGNGLWSIPTNWLSYQVANGQGKTAWFTNHLRDNRTITMDSSRTLGALNIGNDNPQFAFTLAASGGALTFDNNGMNAQLNQLAISKGDTIDSTLPLLLKGSLDIANASGNPLTVNPTVTANSTGAKTLANLGAGTGTVTLSGNIADGGGGTVAVVQNSSTSPLVLSGAANAYNGGSAVVAGRLQFNSGGAIGGSGRNVTVDSGATVAVGYAIEDAFLNRLAENNNAFTVALGANSGNALDFNSSAGANLPNASLGAVGACTFSGALTPNGTTWRLGGGDGTLTFNPDLSGDGYSLVVSGPGTVILNGAAGTFTGDVTVNSGTLQLNSAGAFNGIPRAVAINAAGVLTAGGIANVYDGCAITLNGGTLRIDANPLGNTTPTTTTVVGGNILVNADSIVNAYDSRSGRYYNEIQFGSLAFAAADPVAYPDGYKLRTTDAGRPDYRTSRTYTRFANSTIANNGRLGVYAVPGGENPYIYSTLDNTAIRAGKKLSILNERNGFANVINALSVALLGGAELLNANAFTMIDASGMGDNFTDNSTFDTTGGMWAETPGTTIMATLANEVGSISPGGSTTFTAASAADVSLTGLTVGNVYTLTLTLANPANQAAVLTQLAKNPAFSHIAAAGASHVTLQFTAPAEPSYFAWDNLHTSAANWYLGSDLTGVALSSSAGGTPVTMGITSDGTGNWTIGGTTSPSLSGTTLHLYISHDLGLGLAGFVLVPNPSTDGAAMVRSDGTFQFLAPRNPAVDGTPSFYLVK